jgi:hypothetical protein
MDSDVRVAAEPVQAMAPLQMAITLFLQLHVEGGWTKGKDSRYWIVKAEHCRDRACSRACASDQGLRSTLVACCFEDGGRDRHSLHCSRRCCCCRGVSVSQPPNYAPEAGFGAEGQLESRLPRNADGFRRLAECTARPGCCFDVVFDIRLCRLWLTVLVGGGRFRLRVSNVPHIV